MSGVVILTGAPGSRKNICRQQADDIARRRRHPVWRDRDPRERHRLSPSTATPPAHAARALLHLLFAALTLTRTDGPRPRMH